MHMRSLLANKCFYLCITIVFAIGIAVGLPFELNSFSLKFEIDFIRLCEIAITIVMALYITNALEKKVQDNRMEKELFISKVRNLEQCTIELRNALSQQKTLYSEINSIISRCRIKKNNTIEAVKTQFNLSSDNVFQQISTDIHNSVKSIKFLMTNTDVGKKSEVSLKDDVLTYSLKRKSLIVKELDNFEDGLFKLIILINSL